MSRSSLSISLLLLTGCLWACSSANEKDPLLDEAARYHQQATDIQAVVEPQLDQIDSLKTVLRAKNTPASLAALTTLDSLKTAFDQWEENIVEVPGMPHNHAHRTAGPEQGKHEHKHADATLNGLPAGQMRDLQREMLKSIQQIQAKLKTLVQSTH